MKLKVLTKYTVISILKVSILTALLAALMLMGVDLFRKLDTYLNYNINGLDVLKLTVLYFPEAFLLGLGPSCLFAITYFLSQFHASNEYISVLNSGVKYGTILKPCIITGLCITLFFFFFNELIAIPCSNKKEALYKQLTYKSEKTDNYNIAISDIENGYLVYIDEYNDSSKQIYNVTLIEKNPNGKIVSRINAHNGKWDSINKNWILKDVYIYRPDEIQLSVSVEHYDSLNKENFKIEPELFRNLDSEISKMSLKLAKDYINRIKNINSAQYASMATEYYKRILECITPLVMILISCSMNYKFKKNAMFFSLLCSICIAVVYYVVQMITIMLADQGVIFPAMGMIIPFICIIIVTQILSFILRK